MIRCRELPVKAKSGREGQRYAVLFESSRGPVHLSVGDIVILPFGPVERGRMIIHQSPLKDIIQGASVGQLGPGLLMSKRLLQRMCHNCLSQILSTW